MLMTKDLESKVIVTKKSTGEFLGENRTKNESYYFPSSDKSQGNQKGLWIGATLFLIRIKMQTKLCLAFY